MPQIKTPKDRVTEAVDYIQRLQPFLGAELRRSLLSNRLMKIGWQISLGKDGEGIEPAKRTALRALLLCQQYFFSGIRGAESGKETSFQYWQSRSRSSIDKAILLFTASTGIASKLADVAEGEGNPPSGHHGRVNFTMSRNEGFDVLDGTCYNAVLAWLLKSGLVSYQWFLRATEQITVAGLRAVLGTPVKIWDATDFFTEDADLGVIPRGHILNIYSTKIEGHGHWMVSGSNGSGIGCNNTQTQPGVNAVYDANLPLGGEFYHRYFRESYNNYKKQLEGGDSKNTNAKLISSGAVACVYNPAEIPNRTRLSK